MSDLTEGEICRGELRLTQPARGYRFNLDSLLLADFAWRWLPDGGRRAMDLGAGCGVVGLLLARRDPDLAVILVELQPALAELARRNAEQNGLGQKVEVLEADLASLDPAGQARPQLVVSNPPFYPQGSGRLNPDPQVATARHELACTLADLCDCAGRLLAPGGRFSLVHLRERMEEVLESLNAASLAPRILRKIQPLPDRPANRFLVMAEKGWGGGLEEEAPLLVREAPGVYTEETKGILRED